jgi:mannosyl-3-phosphoglycerate synthase
MRIEIPREAERLGRVVFHGVQRILELDAGLRTEKERTPGNPTTWRISYERRQQIERQMAIVVPVRKERIRLIEGVLCGIPHDCLTLVISNSPREPIDRFLMEKAAIERFGKFIDKTVAVIHQKDPALAEGLMGAGYPELLDEQGLVRDGKAEGMIVATLLARLAGKKFVGFVDSDNYFPGSVLEYVRAYSAGFAFSESPYSMVRISWHSKPKVIESSLFFAKWGRVSTRTNQLLNDFVSHYTGFGTDVIKTGNAGEHALSTDLAMLMSFAPGFAIEPHHFIDLWEKFGGLLPSPFPEVMRENVEIFQIESRNPHLHEEKGDEHVESMSYDALRALYQSAVCPPALKAELLGEMRARGMVGAAEEPAPLACYPPLRQVDLARFRQAIQGQPYAGSLQPAAEEPKAGGGTAPNHAGGDGFSRDRAAAEV